MDANSFGMKLDLYMEFRFWMMKNENVSGEERVNAAVSSKIIRFANTLIKITFCSLSIN